MKINRSSMKFLMIRSLSEPIIVMGLLDRFKRVKEIPETIGELELELSRLTDWSQREFKSDIDTSLSKIRNLYEDIVSSFDNIRNSLKKLEEATFEEGNKTYAAANMIKNTFVNKTNNILKHDANIDINYDDLKKFYLNSIKTIRELTNISPKQKILLTSYFTGQTKEIIDSVKATETKLNKLNEFLDNKGKVIWVSQKIKKDSEKQEQAINKYVEYNSKIESKRKEIDSLEKESNNGSERLENLIQDKRWAEIAKLEKDVYYIENKLRETKNEIDNVINNINKPLKKLEYAASHGYSPGNGFGLITKFLENLFDSIMTSEGLYEFKQVLEFIRKGKQDNKIELKPKDEEKILDLIRRCGSDLPLIIERYRKLKNQFEEKKSISLHPELIQERASMEETIKEQKKELKLLHKDIEYIENDMKLLLNEINIRKENLEKILSDHLNKKITITQSV